MTQLREPPCLGMKALGVGVGGVCPGVEDLDRDRPPQLLVLGEKDLAVSPRTEGTFDEISAKRSRDRPLSGGLRRWRIEWPVRPNGLAVRTWRVRPVITHALSTS
jgi:hypothetical protein